MGFPALGRAGKPVTQQLRTQANVRAATSAEKSARIVGVMRVVCLSMIRRNAQNSRASPPHMTVWARPSRNRSRRASSRRRVVVGPTKVHLVQVSTDVVAHARATNPRAAVSWDGRFVGQTMGFGPVTLLVVFLRCFADRARSKRDKRPTSGLAHVGTCRRIPNS